MADPQNHRFIAGAGRAQSPEAQARKGLSQEELVDLANIHQTYLSGVERGKRNPTVTVLQRIAEALGADIEDLVNGRR
jgi:transcriptional regulator with XRE-family HTH domain